MKTGATGMVEICSPTFFGFAFADEKHEEMDPSNVYLGVLTDFSTMLCHTDLLSSASLRSDARSCETSSTQPSQLESCQEP